MLNVRVFEFLRTDPLTSTDSYVIHMTVSSDLAVHPGQLLVSKDADYSTFNSHMSKVTYGPHNQLNLTATFSRDDHGPMGSP